MTKIARKYSFISVLSLTLFSCGSTRYIAGTYHSRFAELYMFGTTIRLKEDRSMQYIFQGDLLYDSATGRYRTYGNKIYVEFDKEVQDSNKLYYRFDNMPQKYACCGKDTVPYKMFFYIGRNKLFAAHSKTGRKITRSKAYNRRRKFLLFGSHYYRKKFYYRKVA